MQLLCLEIVALALHGAGVLGVLALTHQRRLDHVPQLLRIQRELNEKYENEQPQASAAYAQEAAVAVADEPAQEAAACAPAPPCTPPGAPGTPGKSIGGFLSGLLSNISIDDLILIGIGILLLLDGDEGNDAILILILALLFL